jgi:phosphoribosylglycinamide formyltransferase-1
MTSIAIFASGAGSNAEKIMERLQSHPTIRIGLLVCNKPGAGVFAIAERFGVKSALLDKKDFIEGEACLALLRQENIQFIVLAGFLLKIPPALVAAFPGKIINIHPALLPNYGGHGMYGMHVHKAVLANAEKESGITIHYVDEQYDHGSTIFQATCPVLENDTPETLAKRVHVLEHLHFPRIVEETIKVQTTR